MTDKDRNSDVPEVDIVDENDITKLKFKVAPGNLELPPGLAEESPEADQLDHLENEAGTEIVLKTAVSAEGDCAVEHQDCAEEIQTE